MARLGGRPPREPNDETMNNETWRVRPLAEGTVTSPRGFRAGGIHAGIKTAPERPLDLGILVSDRPCQATARFTTNRFQGAALAVNRARLAAGPIQAIVANSGCSNTATGERGLADALEMAQCAAAYLGLPSEAVLVASTGLIGSFLPMAAVRPAIGTISPSTEGGHDFARAILTTDTVTKEAALIVQGAEGTFTIGGAAKGSGMIHPSMATMFCFLTTDAPVSPPFLRASLAAAVDLSFNMVTVDGDTSPDDMVVILANGTASIPDIDEGSPAGPAFRAALDTICVDLARAIARDAEGATKLITVVVDGACSTADARLMARTIASSPLVKTAVHGGDPNWGRVLAAAGRSGAELDPDRIDLDIAGHRLFEHGSPRPYDATSVSSAMAAAEIEIRLDLHLGTERAIAWGCDLSEEYVRFNADYTT